MDAKTELEGGYLRVHFTEAELDRIEEEYELEHPEMRKTGEGVLRGG